MTCDFCVCIPAQQIKVVKVSLGNKEHIKKKWKSDFPSPFWKEVYSKMKDFDANGSKFSLTVTVPSRKEIILTPLNPPPLLYNKTGVYRGIHSFSHFCSKNIDYGYSLELPHWGSSNEYPQSMFWAEIWKISEFLSENFHFLAVKFSEYLNRLVFIMASLRGSSSDCDLDHRNIFLIP